MESRKALDRTRLPSSTGVRIRRSIAWYCLPYRGTGTSINRIGLSSVCRCPPPIDSSWSWDRQWLSWWADCCSGWQSSDRRIGPTMNTLESLGDYAWNQSRSIHRTKQVKWLCVLPNRGSLEYLEHWWNGWSMGTGFRYTHNSKPCRCGERDISHGV